MITMIILLLVFYPTEPQFVLLTSQCIYLETAAQNALNRLL